MGMTAYFSFKRYPAFIQQPGHPDASVIDHHQLFCLLRLLQIFYLSYGHLYLFIPRCNCFVERIERGFFFCPCGIVQLRLI